MVKRYIATLLSVAIFATTAKAESNSFLTVLAERLGADPENLVLNVPPRPDAWPEAIFTSNLRVPIRRADPNDTSLKRGEPVRVDATNAAEVGVGAGAGFWSMFGRSVNASDVAEIAMMFPDALIVDMEYNNLLNHIQLPGPVVEAITRGQIPLIVIKSYVGTPTITVKRKSGASADAYAKLKSGIEARAQGSAGTGDSVTYGLKQPIVFAFETAQIQVDPTDLIHQKLTIHLASLPAQLFLARQDAGDAVAAAAKSDWTNYWASEHDWKYVRQPYYPGEGDEMRYVYGRPESPLIFSNPH